MTHGNIMNKIQWEGIQLCVNLGEQYLVIRVEVSRVCVWYIVRKGGHPITFNLLVLMLWSHADIDFSYWSHVYMMW